MKEFRITTSELLLALLLWLAACTIGFMAGFITGFFLG